MNPIIAAIEAVVAHIKHHTAETQEDISCREITRKNLEALTKEELIEELIKMKCKSTVKLVQADLLGDILCDPICQPLSYSQISDAILDNLDTDMKFSIENIRWYKTHLQNTKGLAVLNRPTAAERKELDRKLLQEVITK